MFERMVIFTVVDQFEFRPDGSLIVGGTGVDVDKNRKSELFATYGNDLFALAAARTQSGHLEITGKVDRVWIPDGPMSAPRLVQVILGTTVVTFGFVWHQAQSTVSYDKIVDEISKRRKASQLRVFVDALNYLMFGE